MAVDVIDRTPQMIRATMTADGDNVAGGWVELGAINLGCLYKHLWFSVGNGHATLALTNFRLVVVTAVATTSSGLSYVIGASWLTGITPNRIISGTPNTLAAGAKSRGYVCLCGAPGIIFSIRQGVGASPIPITLGVTIAK